MFLVNFLVVPVRRWHQLSRGPRGPVFLSPFRGAPGVVRDGLLALAAAAGGISSPASSCSASPHTRTAAGSPASTRGAARLRSFDPIPGTAQPPAACQRPQLPTSPKIGATRDPKKDLP
jgi:hypothetical protein